MALRQSQGRTNYEQVDAVRDPAHPIVEAVPRAIVRGPNGSTTWVARCPRCWDHNDESVVTGTDDCARAQCAACGAIVEVRESGIFAAAPTMAPPKR